MQTLIPRYLSFRPSENEPCDRPVSGHILHFHPDGSQDIEIESRSPFFSVAKAKHKNGQTFHYDIRLHSNFQYILMSRFSIFQEFWSQEWKM